MPDWEKLYSDLCGNAVGSYTCAIITGEQWDAMSEDDVLELIESNKWEPLEDYDAATILEWIVNSAASQLETVQQWYAQGN